MPRLQVYLPDDLHQELKRRKLPASELLQRALREEIRRQDLVAAHERYVAELAPDVAEPTAHQREQAELIARRLRGSMTER